MKNLHRKLLPFVSFLLFSLQPELENFVDETIQTQLRNVWSKDSMQQNAAYTFLMAATEQPVDWAYDVWQEMVTGLNDKDNHVRAISAQVLCNLAQSDPEKRMLQDFDALLAVTKDKRFVTARHCLQAIWKVGKAGDEQLKITVDGLEKRFRECNTEKNCTLIRYDIIQGLRNLYDETQDDGIREKALELIATEDDLKYRKKYATLWRGM